MKVLKDDWDSNDQKINGSSEEVQHKNRRLKRIKSDLDALEQELSATIDVVTSQHIVDVFVGKKQKRLTVSRAFENHLETIRNPHDKEEALKEKSMEKWDRSKELVEEFLKSIKMENLSVIVRWRESGSSSHLVKVGVWVVILKNGLSLPFAFQPRLRTT